MERPPRGGRQGGLRILALKHREGVTGTGEQQAAELPSAERVLAWERHRLRAGRGQHMGHIVVGGPPVVTEVVRVWKRGGAVGIRRKSIARPHVQDDGPEAVRKAPHDAHEQRAIVERSGALRLGDRKRRIDAKERPIDVRGWSRRAAAGA